MKKSKTDYIPIVNSLHQDKYDDGFFFDFANTAIPAYLFLENQYAPLLQGWYSMLKCYHYLYDNENHGLSEYVVNVMRFANGNMDGITSLIAASIRVCIDNTFLEHTYLRLTEDYNALMFLIQALKLSDYNYKVNAICSDLDCGGKPQMENNEILKSSLTLYINDVSIIRDSITMGAAIEILEKYNLFLKNDFCKLIYKYDRLDTATTLLLGPFREYKRGNRLLNAIATIETAGRLKYNQ
jgi:hypothetical protein